MGHQGTNDFGTPHMPILLFGYTSIGFSTVTYLGEKISRGRPQPTRLSGDIFFNILLIYAYTNLATKFGTINCLEDRKVCMGQTQLKPKITGVNGSSFMYASYYLYHLM